MWSGDTVQRDEEGYLYFVGRRDEMIKTSGYRVSPTEIEEVVYATGPRRRGRCLRRAAPDRSVRRSSSSPSPRTGAVGDATSAARRAASAACRPSWCPRTSSWRDALPRNPNGKIDRKRARRRARDAVRGRAHVSAPPRRAHAALASIATTRDCTAVRRPATSTDIARERRAARRSTRTTRARDRRARRALRAALPAGVHLHYAMKANPMPASSRT